MKSMGPLTLSMIFVDPFQRTQEGETVLHWACLAINKNTQLLQLLLDLRNK